MEKRSEELEVYIIFSRDLLLKQSIHLARQNLYVGPSYTLENLMKDDGIP